MLGRPCLQPFAAASLLMLCSALATAGPWQCQTPADGFWDCTGPQATTDETDTLPAMPDAGPTAVEDIQDEVAGTAAEATDTIEPSTLPAQDEPAPELSAPEQAVVPAGTAPLFPTTSPSGSSPDTGPGTEPPDEPSVTEDTAEPVSTTPAAEPPGETPGAWIDDEPASETTSTTPAVETATEETPEDGGTGQPVIEQSAAEAAREPASDIPQTEAAAVANTTDEDALAITDIDESSGVTPTLSTITGIGDERLDEAPAYSRWVQCPPIDYRRVKAPTGPPGTVKLQADNAQARDNNIFILEGNAVAEMDWQRLEADRMTYNQDEGRIDAEGNLVYTSPELLVDGSRGTLYPETDIGDVAEARYALPDQHARGVASSVELEGSRLAAHA